MSEGLVVIGLGYAGLPLVQAACQAGMSVTGLDTSADVVATLNAGVSHVGDITDGDLGKMIAAGFTATTEPTVIGAADTVVICVPTPLSESGGPDLSAVTDATRAVADHMGPGTLVVLESTTYPGTTDELVRPILETSGLISGCDFHLAYSPERIDPGNLEFGVQNTPKVVGGHTPACTDRAVTFYRRIVETVVTTRGMREAETTKLLENTYRHINIAFVNELARLCHALDIDLWDVIRAAATKPFGFQPFYPGPGVGGHCIPVDSNYLSHSVRAKLGRPFRFLELAHEINASMPTYVARRAQNILNRDGRATKDADVLLLGVAYKPNIADQRESPAAPLARELDHLGARLFYHDPYVPQWCVPGVTVVPVDDPEVAAANVDLVILTQNHKEYDVDRIAALARRFFDTRGVSTQQHAQRL